MPVRAIDKAEEEGFHPFQGRAPFGQKAKELAKQAQDKAFPSLSGKSSIRTIKKLQQVKAEDVASFHPFQGRAPFGRMPVRAIDKAETEAFPSLSGKSSIRTVVLDNRVKQLED